MVDDEFHLHEGKAYMAGREGVESLWCRDLFTLHVYKVDGIGFVLKKQSDPDDTAVRLQDVTNRHEVKSLAFIKKTPGSKVFISSLPCSKCNGRVDRSGLVSRAYMRA